ncbi:MAG TPA: tail-specific protease [Myxococcales bacterium]|nr:tail-specific protease [Myxococcales bacterium]HIL01961.1 tail-specific protease [Myxococcales bacterium]
MTLPIKIMRVATGLLIALAMSLLGGSAGAAKSEPGLNCSRIPELSRTLLHKHISFHYVNDELRQRIIDTYVKRLDASKSLYLSEEVEALKKKLRGVIQQIRDDNCSALAEIQEDQILRYEALQEFATQVLANDEYELDTEAVLIIDPDKRSYSRTDEARKELVTKLIHFQMSNYVSSDMDLAEAREKLTHRYELMTRRAKEKTSEDLYADYLDAFATALDPHSNYLSAEVLEDFQISMGLSLEGIGVALSTRDGYSVVEKVIPGGAAAGLKILEPQDKIIAVAQDGEDPVDIIDMDLRDVVRLIRGKRGTTVHLTVLRQGDTAERFQVSIVRDKINLEEQAAKIRFEEVQVGGEPQKIAVLELPSFYGGNDPGGRQSSEDVAALLDQARKEKAVGLVLDLSRNGGGLLDTSVDIAGLFIEEGGIVAVRDTFSQVQVLRDPSSQIAWDGPLVVLISRVSASASEIVAGALKDYRRAVIVGDDHSFGKGTVQSMVPLPEGLGALKVTTALFFRPGGQSTQHAGVASDVIIPSIFGTDEFGEAHQTYSLPTQSIAAFIDTSSLPSDTSSEDTPSWKPITPALVQELVVRSQKRVEVNEDLIKVRERIAKADARNGVVHLAELMKEKEEEEAAKEEEAAEKEAAADDENSEEVPSASLEAPEGGKDAALASAEPEAEDGSDLAADTSTDTADGSGTVPAPEVEEEEEDQPSPQQLEAVQILADLIQLTS